MRQVYTCSLLIAFILVVGSLFGCMSKETDDTGGVGGPGVVQDTGGGEDRDTGEGPPGEGDVGSPGDEDADAGEDIVEAPPECVQLVPLRFWERDPSAVMMLFQAEDCETGEGLARLGESAFEIKEDERALPGATTRLLPSKAHRAYITLLIDSSRSALSHVGELQDGARRFIDEILVDQNLANTYIGIEVFDGSPGTISLQLPTRDVQKLKEAIDELSTFSGPDMDSTNLYGAVRQGVEELQDRQQLVMHENHGGIVTSGHLIVFSAGDDTAGREDKEWVRELVESARSFDMGAAERPTVRTSAVVLNGGDSTPAALAELFGESEWVIEAERAELSAAFKTLGIQTAKSVQGTYLLTYCSAARAGWHTVSVSVAGAESNHLIYEFDAQDFEGGCVAELFEPSCDSKSCGGFYCGACDDETEFCDGAETGQCVNNCLDENLCSGEWIENRFGYTQVCDFGERVYQCAEQCVDTESDANNCGACGVACPGAESCVAGICVCDGNKEICGGECVDVESDAWNCGGCDQRCGLNEYCTMGDCVSGPQVSAGNLHTCGVKSDGSVVCWGRDELGETTPPTGSFRQLAAGINHTCGIKIDGSVACWGSNFLDESTPPAGSFIQISARHMHTCGIKSDGSLICWGQDDRGQSTSPSGSFRQVSAGGSYGCALKNDGTVVCWGDNYFGQATPPSDSFHQISAGGGHTCGIKLDGSVVCWGNNDSGKAEAPPGRFIQVSAGSSHNCGVKSDGSVVCWGADYYGQSTPPPGQFIQVSAGSYSFSCGVKRDGSAVCWGYEKYNGIPLLGGW